MNKYATNYAWDCTNYIINLVINLVEPNPIEVIAKNKKEKKIKQIIKDTRDATYSPTVEVFNTWALI